MQWLLIWFLVVMIVTVLNKTVLSVLNCPYPITNSLVHLLSSFIYSGVISVTNPKLFNKKRISDSVFFRFILMSILFSINIVLSSFSLKYCSLALDQMVRCTVPAWTAILQYFITGEKISLNIGLSLIPIIIGSAMVCYGDIWVTPTGLYVLFISVLVSTLKGIFSKMILSGEQKISPYQTLLLNSGLGSVELFPLSLYSEMKFYTDFLVNSPPRDIFLVLFNGFVAFLVNISNFHAIKQTSALVMNVAANIRQVLLVLFSVFVFHSSITPVGVIGCVLTILGSMWYSYERSRILKLTKKEDMKMGESDDMESTPLLQK